MRRPGTQPFPSTGPMTRETLALRLAVYAVTLLFVCPLLASPRGNRLTYLHREDPYYPGGQTARLVTPQWVGEEGVKTVIVPAIDDLLNNPAYQDQLLRPMIERLQRIDGRAPITHFAVRIEPDDPLANQWIREGLSIDTHTWTHPCPFFALGDIDKIREEYDLSMDQKFQIPHNHPVGTRLTCIDIWNTVSPRFYTEVFGKRSQAGNFLQLSSSVTVAFSDADPTLPKELVFDEDGRPRFTKYFNQGVTIFGRPNYYYGNYVMNYPFPYQVATLAWELPTLFSDHAGAEYWPIYGNRNLKEWVAAMDLAVLMEGSFALCFHAHGRTQPGELVDFVDIAQDKYPKEVKFLNVQEVVARINKHLLLDQPLRHPENGQDNGVRMVDVNDDGYMDVLIGNEHLQRTRLWDAQERKWLEGDFPAKLVAIDAQGARRDAGVRLGVLGDNQTVMLVASDQQRGGWRFTGGAWRADDSLLAGLEGVETASSGVDRGVRLHDLDGDGACELIVANTDQRAVYARDSQDKRWVRADFTLPDEAAFVDAEGRDAGLRLVDINADGRNDLLVSNDERYALYYFTGMEHGWSNRAFSERRGPANDFLPRVVRNGTNNGAWFADGRMWVHNEFTCDLPDHARILTFQEIMDHGRFHAGPVMPSQWLVAGAFPNEDEKGLHTLFAPERSLDRIDLTARFEGIGGREVRWTPFAASEVSGVPGFDVQRFVAEQNFRTNDLVVYLATWIDSPDDQDAALLLGSEDGVKVWLGGELVHEKLVRRPARLGDDRVPLRLKAGSNLLMVKLEQISAGGALVAAIRSEHPVEIEAAGR